ncbi:MULTISPECIES: mycofactocin system transcriptional regulator [Subtercola]|uniref:Mycofactocin system transcriptional regulator n=1 Tax=Subtercola vilae TaxID=2056433 RepID=A0A4T2BWP3_9MICO|nr:MULTISPECIES: mycofactocin system transcriptional regulator [Subtercola]MEA9985261.1 mycofactocin system transcriptional regulator [Subtercola sp. RTI3]TIH35649.1 mycofactocin system transcriptional regulator [Subtercola vilae]
MSTVRLGRQPSTSQAELSHIALTLFVEHGFDNTTVDDIASAAGIGRRTFFRYFSSKNDLPWGDFETQLASMRAFLASLPTELPLIDALCMAVIEFNRLPPAEITYHRRRMELLLTVPTLVAHSTLRYAAWRQVVADYAAERMRVPSDSLEPQAIAWAVLGVSLSAYEQWLKELDADLPTLLSSAFEMVRLSFAGASAGAGAGTARAASGASDAGGAANAVGVPDAGGRDGRHAD